MIRSDRLCCSMRSTEYLLPTCGNSTVTMESLVGLWASVAPPLPGRSGVIHGGVSAHRGLPSKRCSMFDLVGALFCLGRRECRLSRAQRDETRLAAVLARGRGAEMAQARLEEDCGWLSSGGHGSNKHTIGRIIGDGMRYRDPICGHPAHVALIPARDGERKSLSHARQPSHPRR